MISLPDTRRWSRLLLAAGLVDAAVACQKKGPEEGYTEVSGRAVDAVTGQPVPGALVQLLQTDGGGGGNGFSIGGSGCARHLDSVRADAAGNFQFTFEADGGQEYSMRATRSDYLHLSAFDICQPKKLPQVRKGRKTMTDVPLKPTAFVRIHAVDDHTLTQYKGGSVFINGFFLGGEHRVPDRLLPFGKNAYSLRYIADTSAVFLYPYDYRPFFWGRTIA